jgi:hypothetical protein
LLVGREKTVYLCRARLSQASKLSVEPG